MTDPQPPFQHSFDLPAPPSRVFAAFTDPAELRAWFAEHVEIEAKAGGAFRFWGRHTVGTPAEHDADQEIAAFEKDSRLAFTWTLVGLPSRVELRFEDAEYEEFLCGPGTAPPPVPGCQLTVRHEIEGELPFPRPMDFIDDHWRLSVGNLMAHLAGDGNVVLPDYGDETAEVRLSIEIDAPVADVFKALVEPEALNQWFAKSATVDPVPGGVFDLGWGKCEILEIETDRKLCISWPDWRGNPEIPDQVVTWELEDRSGKTLVNFSHTGFLRVVDRSDFQQGWTPFLTGLIRTVSGSNFPSSP